MAVLQSKTSPIPLDPRSALAEDLGRLAYKGSRFTTQQAVMPSVATLLNVVNAWKRANQVVVFTNGCFDLFHPGHSRFLLECSHQGTRLIVGINSDESVRKLKGSSRPMIPLLDRILMVASQKPVDAVIVFGEDTPVNLISAIRPHVLCKGEKDFRTDGKEPIPGANLVQEWGGRVVPIPCSTPYSTTGLIEWMKTS